MFFVLSTENQYVAAVLDFNGFIDLGLEDFVFNNKLTQ